MKILMINKYFYVKGGSENYMFALKELLKQKGHKVIDFSMQDENNQPSKYSKYFIKNIDFSKRQGPWQSLLKVFHALYSLEAQKKLELLILNEKPAIAHLHNFNFQLTPAIIKTLKKYKIPIIWTMHDYKLICPNYRLFTQGSACERCKVYKYYNCVKYKCLQNKVSFSFLAMLEMYLHKLILRSYHKIDLFISPSKFLKEKVQQWQEQKNIKQVYNFIDVKQFHPNEQIGEGLVYFGRLSEEKGIFVLLKAMKGFADIPLNIIGDGPLKQEIKDYIKVNKLTNVKLLGYKKGRELYSQIKKARFVIMPSLWYENNPISVLEAFALGVPVIGAELGGIPELVKDKNTGLLFKAGDSNHLQQIIADNHDNTELIAKMSQNARLWVNENCSAKAHYEQILHIYRKLLK
ncbi:glycosyltransferase family 4 protein [Patescibacteria group bacterium]